MDTLDPDLSALLTVHYHLGDFSLLRILQTRGQRQTLLLGTPAGKLVVKCTHPGRDEDTVAAETGILAHLARYAFPAPSPVAARDGRFYVPFAGGFVSVYQYLEGTHPLPDDAFYTTWATCWRACTHCPRRGSTVLPPTVPPRSSPKPGISYPAFATPTTRQLPASCWRSSRTFHPLTTCRSG